MSDLRSETPATRPATVHPAWVLAGLYLFGIGFGFVEAAVVVDLRAILGPAVGRIAGRSSDDLFPMIPLDRLTKDDPTAARLMRVEVVREAATLVMLAGVGTGGRPFVRRAVLGVHRGVRGLGPDVLPVPEAADRLAGVVVDLGRPVPDPGAVGRARAGAGDRGRDDGRDGLDRASSRKRRAGRSGSRDGTGWRSSRADSS